MCTRTCSLHFLIGCKCPRFSEHIWTHNGPRFIRCRSFCIVKMNNSFEFSSNCLKYDVSTVVSPEASVRRTQWIDAILAFLFEPMTLVSAFHLAFVKILCTFAALGGCLVTWRAAKICYFFLQSPDWSCQFWLWPFQFFWRSFFWSNLLKWSLW